MADVEKKTVEKKTPKKTTKAKKPAATAAHPKYSEMVKAAVGDLKERGGSSRQAILKYIMSKYNVGADAKKVNARVKVALRSGVKSATLKQSKGTGASGSFKLGEKPKADKPKKAKKPKAAKPKKVKTPKKAKKATAEKKTKSPKKVKKATKAPAKKAAPKKVKTPKKATKPKAAKPKAKTPKKAAPKPKKA